MAHVKEGRRCPNCGALLERVEGTISEVFRPRDFIDVRNGEHVELPTRQRLCTFWSCASCEHCEETR